MTIPARCWDWPGFKSCHTEAGHRAYRFCDTEAGHTPNTSAFSDCKSKVMAEMVEQDCAQKLGCSDKYSSTTVSSPTSLKNLPWSTYSASTKTFQQDANVVLKQIGKPVIGTDGKLGPNTCLGFHYVNKSGKVANWVMPTKCAGKYSVPAVSTPSKPQATTAPGPTRQAFTTPTEEEKEEAYAYSSSGGSGKKIAIVAGGAAVVLAGLWLWGSRK